MVWGLEDEKEKVTQQNFHAKNKLPKKWSSFGEFMYNSVPFEKRMIGFRFLLFYQIILSVSKIQISILKKKKRLPLTRLDFRDVGIEEWGG